MKCNICKQEAKSFVAYHISKNNFGAACHKCFDKLKRIGGVK